MAAVGTMVEVVTAAVVAEAVAMVVGVGMGMGIKLLRVVSCHGYGENLES